MNRPRKKTRVIAGSSDEKKATIARLISKNTDPNFIQNYSAQFLQKPE